MMLPDLIPCVTRDDIRQSKKPREDRDAEEKKKFMLDNVNILIQYNILQIDIKQFIK